MLMSDAPLHRLFVLLAPVDSTVRGLPEILAVVQVALEGGIAKSTVKAQLASGKRPSGDLITWTLTQQYQDYDFAATSGARVVRIATHPEYQGMGYGTRALALLADYFNGQIVPLAEEDEDPSGPSAAAADAGGDGDSLATETIAPRRNLPPLLRPLRDRPPERLQWLGVSYGMTQPLYRFWCHSGYTPLYIRLTPNETTGEHSCIMLKALAGAADGIANDTWLQDFATDFRRRFLNLLGYEFRQFHPQLAVAVAQNASDLAPGATSTVVARGTEPCTAAEIRTYCSPYDLRRIESYARSLVDYHVILDTIPALTRLYFQGRLGHVQLSGVQSAILLAVGLQCKPVSQVSSELNIQDNQTLALFNKAVRKINTFLTETIERDIALGLPQGRAPDLPAESLGALDEELEDGASAMDQDAQIYGLSLSKFAVPDASVEAAAGARNSGVVSVRRKKEKDLVKKAKKASKGAAGSPSTTPGGKGDRKRKRQDSFKKKRSGRKN
mmetsp:Transcript_750/g.1947  ORF Transcript_750/g.1947 Transcript_750/m.1947 type:complete len:499 (-) Transcript_750:53-1549(-)